MAFNDVSEQAYKSPNKVIKKLQSRNSSVGWNSNLLHIEACEHIYFWLDSTSPDNSSRLEAGYWIRILQLTVFQRLLLLHGFMTYDLRFVCNMNVKSICLFNYIQPKKHLSQHSRKWNPDKKTFEEIGNPFTYQLTLNRCLTLRSTSDRCFDFRCLSGC